MSNSSQNKRPESPARTHDPDNGQKKGAPASAQLTKSKANMVLRCAHYQDAHESQFRLVIALTKDSDTPKDVIYKTWDSAAKDARLTMDRVETHKLKTDIGTFLIGELKPVPERAVEQLKTVSEAMAKLGSIVPLAYTGVVSLPPPDELSLLTHPIIFPYAPGEKKLLDLSFATLATSPTTTLYYMRTLNGVKTALETYAPLPDTIVAHCLVHQPQLSFYSCHPYSHGFSFKDMLAKVDPKAIFGFYKPAAKAKNNILIINPGKLSDYLNKSLTSPEKMVRSDVLGAMIQKLDITAILAAKRLKHEKKLAKQSKGDDFDSLAFAK